MSLVEPDKRDPYGLAGRQKARNPFSNHVRRIRSKPIIPRAVKEGVIGFLFEIWYPRQVAEAKKRARRGR